MNGVLRAKAVWGARVGRYGTLPPLVGALAIALWGCGGTPAGRPPAEAPAVAASVARVEMTDLTEPFEAGGVVRAKTTAVIVSRVMAEVREVRVKPGDRVRAGEPLVLLDGRELDALAARAEASLAAAQDGVRAVRANQTAAAAALRLATAWHDRVAALRSKNSATPQELDEAVARLREAQAGADGAAARVAEAEAAVHAARAGAEAARVSVAYTILTAPFSGIVAEKRVEAGNMASPGVPLLTVEDTRAFRLDVRLDESRLDWIAPGAPVEVLLDPPPAAGAGSAPLKGTVAEIERTLDPGGHTFLVKIDLPPDARLRSGLFGRARFRGPSRRALAIPASSVLQRGQLTAVFVVDAEGHARFRPITTGETAGGRVEVLAGLEAGTTIVVKPPADLRDGARITVLPAAPGGGR